MSARIIAALFIALSAVNAMDGRAEAGGFAGKFLSKLKLGADEPVLLSRPEIKQHLSLDDGSEEQLRLAITDKPTKTTNKKIHVNSLLTNPPDTSENLLPLDDVLIYMLKNNPDIGIAHWQTEDSRHAVRSARAARLPSLDVRASSGPENVNSGTSAIPTDGLIRQEVSVRISQLLFDFGKTSQTIKRAKALNQSAELLHKDAVEDTVLRTTQAYLDLLGVSQILDNGRENVVAHEQIYELVRLSGEGGNASEADVKRALTRLDRARTNAIDIENQKEAAVGLFRRVTGLEPGRLIEPDFDVSAAYDLRAEIVDDILAENPAMQSALRDTNAIRHQVKASKRAHLPDIRLELNSRHQERVLGDNPWQNDARAVVTVSWNAYDGGASRALTRQLGAREQENRQRVLKLRNELKQEVFNVLSVLKTSRDKTRIFEDQVAASEQVVDLYFKQFQAGQRTLLELLDAQADLSTARDEQITNKYEQLAASFASLRFQNKLTSSLTGQIDKITATVVAEDERKIGLFCRGVIGGITRAATRKCGIQSKVKIAPATAESTIELIEIEDVLSESALKDGVPYGENKDQTTEYYDDVLTPAAEQPFFNEELHIKEKSTYVKEDHNLENAGTTEEELARKGHNLEQTGRAALEYEELYDGGLTVEPFEGEIELPAEEVFDGAGEIQENSEPEGLELKDHEAAAFDRGVSAHDELDALVPEIEVPELRGQSKDIVELPEELSKIATPLSDAGKSKQNMPDGPSKNFEVEGPNSENLAPKAHIEQADDSSPLPFENLNTDLLELTIPKMTPQAQEHIELPGEILKIEGQ